MAAPTVLVTVPLADPTNNYAVNLGGIVATATSGAISVATNTGVIAVQGLRAARLTASSVVTATLATTPAPLAGQEVDLINEGTATISIVTNSVLAAAVALAASSCQGFRWCEGLGIWLHKA